MFIFPDFLLLSTAHVTHTHILCLAVACRLLNTPFDRQVALVRKYSEGLGRGATFCLGTISCSQQDLEPGIPRVFTCVNTGVAIKTHMLILHSPFTQGPARDHGLQGRP